MGKQLSEPASGGDAVLADQADEILGLFVFEVLRVDDLNGRVLDPGPDLLLDFPHAFLLTWHVALGQHQLCAGGQDVLSHDRVVAQVAGVGHAVDECPGVVGLVPPLSETVPVEDVVLLSFRLGNGALLVAAQLISAPSIERAGVNQVAALAFDVGVAFVGQFVAVVGAGDSCQGQDKYGCLKCSMHVFYS